MLRQSKVFLVIELFLLFVLVPIGMFFLAPSRIFPVLWSFALCCWLLLRRDSAFDKSCLWKSHTIVQYLKPMFIRFAIVSLFIGVCVFLLIPDSLFNLVKQRPLLWIMIVILYPILSVYPQELIYRTWFFHRYRELFPQQWAMVLINGIAFGFMHIIFQNWLAVLLTTLGGMLFAYTYQRSRSTFLVSIEHALFGCLMFTIGLGQYFYIGGINNIPQSLKI